MVKVAVFAILLQICFLSNFCYSETIDDMMKKCEELPKAGDKVKLPEGEMKTTYDRLLQKSLDSLDRNNDEKLTLSEMPSKRMLEYTEQQFKHLSDDATGYKDYTGFYINATKTLETYFNHLKPRKNEVEVAISYDEFKCLMKLQLVHGQYEQVYYIVNLYGKKVWDWLRPGVNEWILGYIPRFLGTEKAEAFWKFYEQRVSEPQFITIEAFVKLMSDFEKAEASQERREQLRSLISDFLETE